MRLLQFVEAPVLKEGLGRCAPSHQQVGSSESSLNVPGVEQEKVREERRCRRLSVCRLWKSMDYSN